MLVDWQLVRSGPQAAEHGVLLLAGGANAARSYREVMAQPVLAGVRLIAATLPGHVGTPRHSHAGACSRLVRGPLFARRTKIAKFGLTMDAMYEYVAVGSRESLRAARRGRSPRRRTRCRHSSLLIPNAARRAI